MIQFTELSSPIRIAWILCLAIVLLAPVRTVADDCPNEKQRLIDPAAATADFFGWATAMDDDVVVVGRLHDYANGTGSANVYRFDGKGFVFESKLVASDAASGHRFGYSVAVRGDLAVVGAPRPGSIYVFRFDGTSWVEEAKWNRGRGFGSAVAIDQDVVVASKPAPNGSLYVFRFDGTAWFEEQQLTVIHPPDGGWFGSSVAIENDWILAGATGNDIGRGAVHCFRYDGSNWIEHQRFAMTGYGWIGLGNALSIRGDRAAAGAVLRYHRGGVEVGGVVTLRLEDGQWIEEQRIEAEDGMPLDRFGESVALLSNRLVVGAIYSGPSRTGSAYVYQFDGQEWVFDRQLHSSTAFVGDQAGRSVAASDRCVIVGTPGLNVSNGGEGAVNVFATELVSCRLGSVNRGRGAAAANVLFVNGEAGRCATRAVDIPVAAPIEVAMQPPPGGPVEAPFVLYAWSGAPDPLADEPQPYGLGSTCFPTFLSVGFKKPDLTWNNSGHQPLLGEPDFPSTPAPSQVIAVSRGWPVPVTFTLQGFIVDQGSAARKPGSVTNAVIVNVR